jgi:uncharacterized membrane protein YvbJ
MDCGKCGADLPVGAETCHECGESTSAASEAMTEAMTEAPSEASLAIEGGPVATAPKGNRTLLIAVVAFVVLLLGAAGYFIVDRVNAAASPEAVATKMFDAYAQFDAKTMLSLSTRDTIKEADAQQFEKQAADAKATAKGAPMLKDIVVGKATITTDTATLEVTAQWLDDPATGKYAQRTDKITLVRRDGKWLVRLF